MICNSGGAIGSDQIFEEECIKKEIPVIAWSFHGHKTNSKNVKILTKEELAEGWEHVKIANESLKRNIYNLSPYVRNLLARNWFQVKNSDAIFAIGDLMPDMKIVRGGTGWAIAESIENNKDTYIFDQSKNMWFKYIYDNSIFEKYDNIPILTDRFAGIGTRNINENGIKSIKDLFHIRKTG